MVCKSVLVAVGLATSPFSLVAASPDDDEALEIYEVRGSPLLGMHCICSYKPARLCFVYQDGDDANEYDEDYEDVAAYTIEYADLHTSVIFPDYPNKHLPLGEEVKVFIGLDNRGSESLNVCLCYAFFWMPHMYNCATLCR